MYSDTHFVNKTTSGLNSAYVYSGHFAIMTTSGLNSAYVFIMSYTEVTWFKA